MHKELGGVVLIAPLLVLVGCNVQDPHATYQYYEEVPMGENPTVCTFFRNFYFLLGELKLQGWVGGVA